VPLDLLSSCEQAYNEHLPRLSRIPSSQQWCACPACACVAGTPDPPAPEGAVLTAIGWGLTESVQLGLPSVLQEVGKMARW